MKNPNILQGYVDADYTEDLERRRSMMGYIFTVTENVVS